MAKVERGNVVLYVDETDINYYIGLGYNLVDEKGVILKEAIPTNLGALQTAFVEHQARIAELEDTVAKLTAQLSEKKRTSKKASTVTE